MPMEKPYGLMKQMNVQMRGMRLFGEHKRIRGPPQSKSICRMRIDAKLNTLFMARRNQLRGAFFMKFFKKGGKLSCQIPIEN